ncbi:ATP phosphoribosyltransferase [Phakopsora pachyrhizi]|uniref:ATP phosphoribosyltransferase n=1 Tax=Phakopsora pachyrhizi TaxID=170000 RepID=A0AAV0ASS3_PHAPC|nr:ATP phosphoribosyltransferase [Phakopsora pachyrhizi]CAH7671842.1 ATP phosphoribosyltransferase [Phakopsora pachyrhizi]CAH7675633.1 ATP phosphoribosyltransferase [Phakopsora pachyrhizi]
MTFFADLINDRLLFAIPKKGRLYEKCLDLLSGADIQFHRSHRLDVCLVKNHPVALVFLPAADIPRFVGEGNVDLAITGQDMVSEANVDGLIEEICPLGFGKCRLEVQVPINSSIKTIEELQGKKVVTSFEVLCQSFFENLDKKLENKQKSESPKKTIVEYIGGSVEAACALGLADGIVDLVESGDTMRAAGLHAIHTIMESQAVLIKSTRPFRGDVQRQLTKLISSRIQGVVAANKYVLCQYNIIRTRLADALKLTPGRRSATVSPLDDGDFVAVSAMVVKRDSAEVMDKLQAIDACDILLLDLANCRV